MNTNTLPENKIINKVIKILDRIIVENSDSLLQLNFKIRPGFGYDKFYLNHVDGSYDMSLQSLIHYILAEEGIYKSILNDYQFAECMKVIGEEPEAIYYPADDSDEDLEIQDLLDNIYFKAIAFTGMRLISMGIDVSYDFKDYLTDYKL
jgi:hypothetical protein